MNILYPDREFTRLNDNEVFTATNILESHQKYSGLLAQTKLHLNYIDNTMVFPLRKAL